MSMVFDLINIITLSGLVEIPNQDIVREVRAGGRYTESLNVYKL